MEKKLHCFEYPLDTKALQRKKKSIKKELLQTKTNWIEKKIAVLGGSTTNEVVDQIELALLHQGIKPDFYQSDYGKYWEDGMFSNDKLNSFNPDIIYIHTNWRNICSFPDISDTRDKVALLVDQEYRRFVQLWESLKNKFNCPIIQNNFERPNYRLLGNRDIWDYHGRSNFIFCLNQKFYDYAQSSESFFINDIDYIAQDFGLSKWNDSFYWNMYKYCCDFEAIPYLAESIANIIKSIYGKNKKLLALDLDNTLWGGIIGDDGVNGIKIGRETPQGQVFREVQTYCKQLKAIGIVLAVNSKNDERNAMEGISHPECILHANDFVSIKANWDPKDQNLNEISKEVTLGLDSFVFIDDNPVERALVNRQLPEVSTPQVNTPDDFIKILDHSGYFEVTSLSLEDLQKSNQYQARAAAENLQKQFSDYREYLKSLCMKALITDFDPISIQRIAQLTNKTNQFNLTTLRCTENDIRAMQTNSNYICMCGRLTDRFTDNGIVTVLAGEIINNNLHIRLWLMSCRVLKRELEYLMMNELINNVKAMNVDEIIGYYLPTEKNGMVKELFKDLGFSLKSKDDKGNTVWNIKVQEYKPHRVYIDVVKQQ